MTTTQWTRVTSPIRFMPEGVIHATAKLTYTSATPMTTGDQLGSADATDAAALVIPANARLINAFIDSNQVDTSGSGAFDLGFTGDTNAIIAAGSVATAATNNRTINVAPTEVDAVIATGRGTFFDEDTAIFITPSTSVGTVNVGGGTILVTLEYTNEGF